MLDADISPEVARVGRSLGMDVVSVYECGRAELTDDAQLRFAAQDRRIFVTRNRNDFLHWTKEFIRTGRPHAGILIVSRSIVATRPEGGELGTYFVDFISSHHD